MALMLRFSLVGPWPSLTAATTPFCVDVEGGSGRFDRTPFLGPSRPRPRCLVLAASTLAWRLSVDPGFVGLQTCELSVITAHGFLQP